MLSRERLLRHIDPDIVEVADVIEGAEADSSFAEGLVRCSHDRRFQIVEINRDLSAVGVANDTGLMPAVRPGGSCRGLCGDLFASIGVHYKDLIRMIISLLAEVHVIKMRVILIAEEQAQ